jgi:ribonuclease P protein component
LRTEHLDVRATDSLLSSIRLGIVVAKHSHSIVERNRLKRRLRELARTQILPMTVVVDLVIRSLPTAYDVEFKQLSDEVGEICLWLNEQGTDR